MAEPLALFATLPKPRPVPGIDLRCCGVEDLLAEVRGVRLIMADPPWRYGNAPGVANPEEEGIYQGLGDSEIAAHLDAAFDCAHPAGARLACWYTWPKDAEWTRAGGAGPRWGERVTGGAWVKTGNKIGVGYHWRGQSEPVAIFTRGTTGRPNEVVLNGWASEPEGHSEKPIPWMRSWIRAWTDPGDLVLDLYAGLGSVARACLAEGRRYVGAEIDPERHAAALAKLAAFRREG